MPVNSFPTTSTTRTATMYSTGSGRKRAFPTPSRRTWKMVSAVTLSASFVATIAFQQTLPLSSHHYHHIHHHHHNSLSPSPSSSTAMNVLTDPTNLVTIESKQSVEDRAALEELYLLSSLAKKATRKKKPSSSGTATATATTTRKKTTTLNTTTNTKRASGGVESTETTMTSRSRSATSLKLPKNTITSRTAASTSSSTASSSARIEDDQTKQTNQKETVPNSTGTKSKDPQTQMQTPPTTVSSAVDSSASASSQPSKKVRFKGLTTVPNRRNQKQKKTLEGPFSERIGIDQDEYIRNLLQKKEDLLSYDSTERSRAASTSPAATAARSEQYQADPRAPTDTIMPSPNSKPKSKPAPNMVFNSLSSTMPGFREGENTFRKKAYADGVKIAQQNVMMEYVETAVSKKKRVLECGQAMYRTSSSVPESLVQFANEIHDVDRITPEEEIELGEKTQEALHLQHIYDGLVNKLDREPTDDEWCAASGKFNMEAIAQIIDEGLEAKNRLVTSNLRMVQGVVNVYIRNGLQGQYNAGDMMQEGILALIRAAEKFDPSRGFRFSTYAMYWIRSAVKRDQCLQSRIIQVPHRLHETNKRISVNRKELTKVLDRPPTELELSRVVEMTVAQIERCETAFSQRIHSLDQNLVNRNNPMTLEDHRDTLYSIITTKSDEVEYNEVELSNLREDLLRALKFHLTEEESSILILKFGMDDEFASSKKIGRSIAEVGEMVGLKSDKVRRIIKRSLTQLETLVGDDFRSYNRDFCI